MERHKQLSSQSGGLAVRQVVLALSLATHLSCCSVSHGEDTAEDLVSRMIISREQLHAGDLTIRGFERRESLGANNTIHTRPVQERIRFDFARARLWHEKTLTYANMDPDSGPLHEIIVYGKGGTYRKSVEAMQIAIGKAGVPSGFWDPRIYGLCTYDDLLRYTTLAKYAEAFREGISEAKFTIGPRGNDGIVVAEYLYGSDPGKPEVIDGRRRIWIDSDRGFVPIRTEQQQRGAGSMASNSEGWMPPVAVSTATWEIQDGVWVPTSAIVKLKVEDSSGEGLAITYDLAFDWLLINPPLDESVFSLERLDVPAGSHYIIDTRLDRTRPLIIQHPAVPDADALMRIQGANMPGSLILDPEARGR